MIDADVSLEKRIAEANTVILSRFSTAESEDQIAFRNGNSAAICQIPSNNFEDWLENPTLTVIKPPAKETENIENIFVSPVKNSIKVRMKVRIGGKVRPIPIDSEEIVYLDE